MANPQSENGHVDIANEIMDALCRTKISSSEWSVLMCIIRKTYGWKKKEDKISISQLVTGTGLSRRMVIYALQNLESRKMIGITKNRVFNEKNEVNIIFFQKNYDLWVVQGISPQYRKSLDRNKLRYAENKKRVVQGIGGSARNSKKVVQGIDSDSQFIAPTKDTITKENKSMGELEIPPALDTIEFRSTWKDWIESRAELKKPITTRAGKMQLKLLAGYPAPIAIRTIEASIRNGWQGLFPEKQNERKSTQASQRSAEKTPSPDFGFDPDPNWFDSEVISTDREDPAGPKVL